MVLFKIMNDETGAVSCDKAISNKKCRPNTSLPRMFNRQSVGIFFPKLQRRVQLFRPLTGIDKSETGFVSGIVISFCERSLMLVYFAPKIPVILRI